MLPELVGIWIALVFAAGIVAYLRGARPIPWMVGVALFPPLLLWVMIVPLPQRNAKRG